MRIFVTGSSGVIGTRVVPALLAAGHEVTAAVRTAPKGAALERRGARIVEADLFAPAQLRNLLQGQDVVINLATHVPPTARMLLPGAWRENDRIRHTGSANLVDAALGTSVQRFIQESFAPIYADQGDHWIDESALVHPARYARTVLDAEAAVARFTAAGRTGVVLRFATFYGPDSEQLRDMVAVVRRGFFPLVGSPRSFLSAISHDDAATAVLAALQVPDGIYNVGDDEPLRHRDFADALADALAIAHPRVAPVFVGELLARLMGGIGSTVGRSVRLNNAKLRAASGWSPRFPSVREGFRHVVDAFPGAPAPRARRAEAPG